MAIQISLHTLVSFVMKPRCTRAVFRLSLLGEQGADVSQELTTFATRISDMIQVMTIVL